MVYFFTTNYCYLAVVGFFQYFFLISNNNRETKICHFEIFEVSEFKSLQGSSAVEF